MEEHQAIQAVHVRDPAEWAVTAIQTKLKTVQKALRQSDFMIQPVQHIRVQEI